MRNFRIAAAVVAVLLLADTTLAVCSPSGLNAVQLEIKAATAPRCGPRALRRAFTRGRNRAARVTARAVIRCATAEIPRLASAHAALAKILARVGVAGV